jgi:hypothetical protein
LPGAGVVSAAFPTAQVERLELAKTDRCLAAVDQDRQQSAAVAADRCLVAYPGRLRRMLRPGDQDDIGAVEGGFDLGRKFAAGADLTVPPDFVATFQSAGQALRPRLVFARITEEDDCDALSPSMPRGNSATNETGQPRLGVTCRASCRFAGGRLSGAPRRSANRFAGHRPRGGC